MLTFLVLSVICTVARCSVIPGSGRQELVEAETREQYDYEFMKDDVKCYHTKTGADGKEHCDWDTLMTGLNKPVNQYGCPACWIMALVALVEARHYQVTGKSIKLSEGFFVDCLGGNGCAGGHPKDGFRFLQVKQYAPGYDSYPWTGGYNGGCQDTERLDATNLMLGVYVTSFRKISMSEGHLEEELRKGPVLVNMEVSGDIFKYDGYGIWEDKKCVYDPHPHSMLVIGYTDTYWLIKNSYGEKWGMGGFVKMARTEYAVSCSILRDMYTINMIPRREIEYTLGKGTKTFADSQAYCMSIGNTLAVIPTKLHEAQVLALFQAKYGATLKENHDFNYFWIDIGHAKVGETWDETDIPIQYQEYDHGEPKLQTIVMDKGDGDWKSYKKSALLRFVCSKFI